MSAVSTSTNLTGSFTAEAFAAHLERVKHLPAWWLDRKRAAYERFAAAPMPKRTNEGWRFSNLATLTLDGFNATQHEASVSKVSEDMIFYMQSRGLTEAQAMSLAVNGFINELARQFPMEYSVELKRLIDLEMEGSVG